MTSTPNLAGKRALVTGGSSGIAATSMRRVASQSLRDH
jgi:NAD(P)-dependent dehydrogenase (short-subunit alcohol dehydrogenase family)